MPSQQGLLVRSLYFILHYKFIAITGTRIGRVKVIFTLPTILDTSLGPQPAPPHWPKESLAFVEWYSSLANSAQARHGMMYLVKKVQNSQGNRVQGAIIPLANIRQSCMLFPTFDETPDITWTPASSLDLASSFLVNNWLSKYSYQSIY